MNQSTSRRRGIIIAVTMMVLLATGIIVTINTPGTVDIETYTPKVYSTLGALLPPIIAIALVLITKEVYSSLYVGIITGALLYSNGNLELMLNTFLFHEEGGRVIHHPEKTGRYSGKIVLVYTTIFTKQTGYMKAESFMYPVCYCCYIQYNNLQKHYENRFNCAAE